MTRTVPMLATLCGCFAALALWFSCRSPSSAQPNGSGGTDTRPAVDRVEAGEAPRVGLLSALVDEAPTLPRLRLELARAHREADDEAGDEIARTQLLTSLCLQPDDFGSLLELGQVMYSLKRYQAAAAWLERAVAERPESWLANHWLGVAHVRAGRVERAIAPLRQAVRLAPDERGPRRQAAEALCDEGLLEEARIHLEWLREQGKDRDEKEWAESRLIRLDLAQGRYTGPEWGETEPPGIGPLLLRTNSHFEKGQHTPDAQRQVDEYTQALTADPGMYQAAYNLGLALIELRMYDQAIPYLKTADELYQHTTAAGPYLDALCQIARCFARLGRPEDGLPYVERAIEIEPDLIVGRFVCGDVLNGLADHGGAVAELTRCLAMSPEHPGATRALGTAYAGLGRDDLAIAALTYAEWLALDEEERALIEAELEELRPHLVSPVRSRSNSSTHPRPGRRLPTSPRSAALWTWPALGLLCKLRGRPSGRRKSSRRPMMGSASAPH